MRMLEEWGSCVGGRKMVVKRGRGRGSGREVWSKEGVGRKQEREVKWVCGIER